MEYVKVYDDGYWCYDTPEVLDEDIQKLYEKFRGYIITERPNAIEVCTNTERKEEVWWQMIQTLDRDNMITLLGYESDESWDIFNEYSFKILIRTNHPYYNDKLDYEKKL